MPAGCPGWSSRGSCTALGEGWTFTAGATWIVDLAPVARRGQAIALYRAGVWGGLSAGPVLGELLHGAGSYEAVWIFAALAPLAGAAVARRVPDPHVPAAATAGPPGAR